MKLFNLFIKILFLSSLTLSMTSCLEQKPAEEPSENGGSPQNPADPQNPGNQSQCDSTVDSMQSIGLQTSPSESVLPLCDGDAILQNQVSNEIGLINVSTQTLKKSWQLTATPKHMIVDDARQFLYVTLTGASKIAKIDLSVNTAVTYISTSAPASWITFGEPGFIFASLTQSGGYWGNIDLINLNTLSVTKTFTGSYYQMMIYNKTLHQLIIGSKGLSPASLYRYAFDSTNLTLTQLEYVFDNGSNANHLVISPDDTKFALSAGGGNTNYGYSLLDYSTSSIAATNGTYNVGAYPSGADFSPDSKYFLTSTGDGGIKVFNTTTHALVKATTLNISMCSYASLKNVAFSRGGKLVYVYYQCGFNDDSGLLYVLKF